MNNTFILLARSILDSEVFANERTLKIWVWCLCKANHKKAFVPLKVGKGTTTVEVKRGQFIFGRNKAADELNIEATAVYRDLQKMQAKGMVKIEPHSQYSLVTICKYDDYQDAGSYECTTNAQPMHKQCTANAQRMHTNKNDNNEENEKEIIYPFAGDGFSEAWIKWKIYKKKQFKFSFKSNDSEQAQLTLLQNMSGNDEAKAIQIIEYTMGQTYRGFVEPKQFTQPTIPFVPKPPKVTEDPFGTPARR